MHKPMIPLLLACAAFGWTPERRGPVTPLGPSEMTLEWTPGEGCVVRIASESEEDLERVQVLRPDGRQLVDIAAHHGSRRGLTGLEIELRESDLDTLIREYAEGTYAIRASTVGGGEAAGSAVLSLALAAAPLIEHPQAGANVSIHHLAVNWSTVEGAIAYEVQIEQGDDDGLRVRLPPQQTSFQVPHDLLAPGTETTVEVVAIAPNGNRTVSQSVFETRP